MVISPNTVSATVATAFANSPQGKIGVVSAPKADATQSPWDILTGTAAKYSKLAGKTILDIFAPNDFNVPGSAPLARAVAKSTIKVGNSIGDGISNVADSVKGDLTSAGEGIKSGFKIGISVVIIFAALWAWSVIRPRS